MTHFLSVYSASSLSLEASNCMSVYLTACLPADCFGHGFSTRSGGVSSGIRSLCSLNLWSSRKRRDPEVMVAENWRRLALHAGFSSLTLHLPKVLPLFPVLPQLCFLLAMCAAVPLTTRWPMAPPFGFWAASSQRPMMQW